MVKYRHGCLEVGLRAVGPGHSILHYDIRTDAPLVASLRVIRSLGIVVFCRHGKGTYQNYVSRDRREVQDNGISRDPQTGPINKRKWRLVDVCTETQQQWRKSRSNQDYRLSALAHLIWSHSHKAPSTTRFWEEVTISPVLRLRQDGASLKISDYRPCHTEAISSDRIGIARKIMKIYKSMGAWSWLP